MEGIMTRSEAQKLEFGARTNLALVIILALFVFVGIPWAFIGVFYN